ncbi:retropepsin-like aspartic protease [Dysgonomonas sp. 25]|uniref:retropepsin-like aspartic protease n=1 Tax=Dysgonomonas sp. 25 TaxID=2302933 RepID=UPI0013D25023|nr:retropepsin-like aspartic protease [Dysgonomonas sp. 25]NDV69235.1 hypothetical protein [Dysgonomonas sp. 25]
MKRILLSLLLCFSLGSALAQSPDEQIGEALSASDFFLLDERYSQLQHEMQSPVLKCLSQSLLDAVFDRQHEAISSIDSLILFYQDEIGFESTMNMLLCQNAIRFRMGAYCEASEETKSFLDLVAPHLDDETVNGLQSLYKYYHSMCGQKKTELIRPAQDCAIPLYIESLKSKQNIRRGYLPYVPVTVNGKEERFIFDTGCPGGVFLSEEYATRYGVRITFDSLGVSGTGGSGMGKMGILDSVAIGDMILKNLVVVVVPSNPAVDSVFKVDAVLGTDIMKLAGEVQIFPNKGKIVFPIHKTPLPATGRNMMKTSGDSFFVKAYSGNERLIMLLDTGDSNAGLNSSYYHRYKEAIERDGKKESFLTGGYGGVNTKQFYTYPALPLRIGSHNFEIKDIYIDTTPLENTLQLGGEEGALGMGFIRLFEKVTISFDHMFIEVE